jgi:anthranilate phosphoribosyltransferase
VIGVADPSLAPLVIDVLRRRDAPRAMVVHGSDGLDELTLTGPSFLWELRDGQVTESEIHPAHLGLTTVVIEDIGVGAPQDNAVALRSILGGDGGARRDVVLLNAAAGLVVSGTVDSLDAGIEVAARSIDSGAAAERLERLIAVSNDAAA